ncbi:MAG: hypothetical protein KF764_10515 [Labilithrix sp.]|nr:hypothetical protein [Labilithrix sp.]
MAREGFYPIAPDGVRNPAADRLAWGGAGRSMNPDGTSIYGTSAADHAETRYRGMGSNASSPATIDQGQSNAARAQQVYALGQTNDAMGLARGAAYGNAPSAAQIYGGRLIDDSINAQMAMAGSAQGGPAAMGAAQRQAAFQGAAMQQSGMRDLSALRAQEMAQARDQYLGAAGSYAGQAGAMRGQDIGVATSQAGLDNAMMDRQQQNQQYYERLAWETRKQEQDSALRAQEGSNQDWAQRRALKQEEDRDDWSKVKDVVGLVGGGLGSIFSDERTKMAYMPAGASPSFAAGGGMLGGSPLGELKAHSNFATRYVGNAGSGPAMLSDARAKREAFVEGINYGDAMTQHAQGGPEPTLPRYMPNQRAPGGGAHGAYALQVDKPSEYDTKVANRPWAGNDEDPLAAANRAQQGSAYTYRPEFAAASGQAPGEMNVGPMAQTMASDPVAGTAVKQDAQTGMLVLDKDKLQKVQSAGIGSLQRQVDDIRNRIGSALGRK